LESGGCLLGFFQVPEIFSWTIINKKEKFRTLAANMVLEFLEKKNAFFSIFTSVLIPCLGFFQVPKLFELDYHQLQRKRPITWLQTWS
jgi:hypothetical protein